MLHLKIRMVMTSRLINDDGRANIPMEQFLQLETLNFSMDCEHDVAEITSPERSRNDRASLLQK